MPFKAILMSRRFFRTTVISWNRYDRHEGLGQARRFAFASRKPHVGIEERGQFHTANQCERPGRFPVPQPGCIGRWIDAEQADNVGVAGRTPPGSSGTFLGRLLAQDEEGQFDDESDFGMMSFRGQIHALRIGFAGNDGQASFYFNAIALRNTRWAL
jgi:hypothetical protein